MYYSQANQDEFVFNILNKKTDGLFVDIGSNDPIVGNNSYFLEKSGWTGICIDQGIHNYSDRSCRFYNKNVLRLDYDSIFDENNFPSVIDYLSIDVDEYSAACLVKIPLEKYKFKVITIEHDSYRFGAGLCNVQRDILSYYGYTLVCKNITCLPLLENQYFEDWWVYSDYINFDITKIQCKEQYCTDIVKKLNESY